MFIYNLFRPHKTSTLLAFLFAFLEAVMILFFGFIIINLYDRGLQFVIRNELITALCIILPVLGGFFFFRFAKLHYFSKLSIKIVTDIKQVIYKKHQHMLSAVNLPQVEVDVRGIQNLIVFISNGFRGTVLFFGSILLTFTFNFDMARTACLLLIIILAPLFYFGAQIRKEVMLEQDVNDIANTSKMRTHSFLILSRMTIILILFAYFYFIFYSLDQMKTGEITLGIILGFFYYFSLSAYLIYSLGQEYKNCLLGLEALSRVKKLY
jgi:ABC-type multidrug transport system fused ATPase/permease subunit